MSGARTSGRLADPSHRRAGWALGRVLVMLAVVAVLLVGVWFALPRVWVPGQREGPMMVAVQRGRFVHEITERGNLESAKNVEIASKVKSTSSGIPILEVVPEGTVIEPEDCIPENAVIPLAAIEQLEQYRRELEKSKARGIAAQGPPARSGGDGDGDGDGHSGDAKPKPKPKPKPAGAAPGEAKPEVHRGAAKPKPDAQPGAATNEHSGETGAAAGGDEPLGVPDTASDEGSRDAPVLRFEDIRDKLVLVRLNSKSLEDQRMQQQIVCETSRASVTQAQSNFDTAVISKEEYLHGEYEKNRLKAESDLLLAEDKLARAREYLDYSKLLHAKGYLSDTELESAGFDVKQKELDLQNARKEQDVLENYTKRKMLKQLEADIETARAKLSAATKSYELDLAKLSDIEQQIVCCTMFSTKPGQVVYANQTNRWGSNEIVIEAGTPIRERQVILRLPDPTQMQVNAKINEAKVSLVKPGMPACIRLEASPDDELQGKVAEVGEYPAPTSWYKGDVKEYQTIIEILGLNEGPRKDLRPGLTAEVKIRVAELPDVLQVPIQAVLEHGGVHYCVVPLGDGHWEAREVQIGLSNDKSVVIEGGLQEGEEVVHHAAKFREELELDDDQDSGNKPSPSAAVPPGAKPGREARPARGRRPEGAPAGRDSKQGRAAAPGKAAPGGRRSRKPRAASPRGRS